MSLLDRLHAAHPELAPARPVLAMPSKWLPCYVVSDDQCEFVEPGAANAPEITTISLGQILAEVARKYAMPARLILGNGRSRELSAPRREFSYRAMTETGASLAAIGRALGGRDHTSIMYQAASFCEKNKLPYPRNSKWGRFHVTREYKRWRAKDFQRRLRENRRAEDELQPA